MATYVVTNFRLDDEFWEQCMASAKHKTPIPLVCEEMLTDTPSRTVTFDVIIEQILTPDGVFTCIGDYESGSCRIEEVRGTLILSVI